MKTLEDLEMMTVDQLKGIAIQLGVETKAKMTKPALVQLVYDIQQPDVPVEEVREDSDVPVVTPVKEVVKPRRADLASLHAKLDELRDDGLLYDITSDVVNLQKGSKVMCTTLNQPEDKIVNVAKRLCGK